MARHHKHSNKREKEKKHKHKSKKEVKREYQSSQSSASSKSKSKSLKKEDKQPKELPCFEPSGILAKYASNAINENKVLKFTQPLDAKIPNQTWKIFAFKDDESLPTILLKDKAAFLFGKDKEVADIYLENPTISAQHAVIQFREIRKVNNKGEINEYIKPYLMDLESTNGTYLNSERIQAARYYELIDQDVLKFGESTREYVIIKP